MWLKAIKQTGIFNLRLKCAKFKKPSNEMWFQSLFTGAGFRRNFDRYNQLGETANLDLGGEMDF